MSTNAAMLGATRTPVKSTRGYPLLWYLYLVPDFQVVAERGRYVLGEEPDSYGIWDLDADDDEPVERFPMTDEGFEEAWARFHALDRAGRRVLVRTLRTAFIAGLILWVLGLMLILTISLFPELSSEGWAPISQAAYVLDPLGFRVAAASALSLAAIAAWRRWFPEGTLEPAGTATQVVAAAGVSGVVLISALSIWIISGLITPFYETASPFEEADTTPTWMRLAIVAQYVGFRVAVLAAVVVVFRWMRMTGRHRSGRDGAVRDVEREERVDEVGEDTDQ